MADAAFTSLENKVWLANVWGNVLCSLVKHLGSGRALKKLRKCVSHFPLHFFRALTLPVCCTTEQSTVDTSLFLK